MNTPTRLAVVGLFVVVGLLLFAVGLFMIGDRRMAFARKFVVYTQFADISGVAPGAIVRVSGAKAGTVEEVLPPTKPSDKFRVKMEITEELHPLVRTDSVAAIQTEGLVGGTFLAIGTGSDQAPNAPTNSTIPSREPLAIANVVEQLRDTIQKVNATIDALQVDLQRSVLSIADTLESTNALIAGVTNDVKAMTSAGARISGDASVIADAIRNGKGTIGKLVNDDELYQHVAGVAKNAEEIASNARQIIEQARQTLEGLRSADGPALGLTSNLKQTIDDARVAMTGFAENMEALKHNVLFRGFFNRRGFFSLSEISPAEYRRGFLTKDKSRRVVRVWLTSEVLFDQISDQTGQERLTDDGRASLDSAIARYLDQMNNIIVIVEGYAQRGGVSERYLHSRARAALTRDYLTTKFQFDPQSTGIMPLGAESTDSPGGVPWDGVALALFVAKPR